jgi:hypothetical protein
MADQTFQRMTDELKQQLTEMVMGVVNEPVQQAINQIPIILSREDLAEEEKIDVVEQLQLAIVTPLVGAAVNAAQACRLELGVFLNLNGHAWEEIRGQLMARIGAEMLSKGGSGGGSPEDA